MMFKPKNLEELIDWAKLAEESAQNIYCREGIAIEQVATGAKPVKQASLKDDFEWKFEMKKMHNQQEELKNAMDD